jgi:rod shape-determining protein MreC
VNGSIGSLVWGEGNFDPRFAYLKDIQSHLSIKKGGRVLTSEFSLFPQGITIGYVAETRNREVDNSLDIKIKLDTDFATLQYVYVINNLLSAEQLSLEAQNKIE